jgi:molybdopterin converting factor small subunit
MAEAGSVDVQIRFFNVLAVYAGTKRMTLTVPAGTSLRDCLERLTAASPEAFRRALVKEGQLTPYLRVFRNEKLTAGAALEQPVADGDQVMLFPAVAGGRS